MYECAYLLCAVVHNYARVHAPTHLVALSCLCCLLRVDHGDTVRPKPLRRMEDRRSVGRALGNGGIRRHQGDPRNCSLHPAASPSLLHALPLSLSLFAHSHILSFSLFPHAYFALQSAEDGRGANDYGARMAYCGRRFEEMVTEPLNPSAALEAPVEATATDSHRTHSQHTAARLPVHVHEVTPAPGPSPCALTSPSSR